MIARLARVPWGLLVLALAFLVPAGGSRFYTFLANDIVIWALFAILFITFFITIISLIPSALAARLKPITAMHHIG